MRDIGPLGHWVLHEGYRSRSMEELFAGFGEAARGLGLPVDRMMITMRTLHPVLTALGLVWEHGGDVVARQFRRDQLGDRGFLDSPIRPLLAGETDVIHLRLDSPEAAARFPVTAELFERGYTDYLALCMLAGDGRPNALTLATRAPGGFDAAQVDALKAGLVAFQVAFDRFSVGAIARNVCATYIGPQTGPRVLGGSIERGAVERLRAAVWFSDVRDFTARSLEAGPERTVELLNGFFGALGAAVNEHDGEILKFIGDAALVIFPVDDGDDGAACRRALAAVRAAREGVAAFNAGWDGAPVQFGVGLHLGEVAYGNIGAPDRLDFTVIGAAVNLAARLESLCGTLGEAALASEAFRDASGLELEAAGAHELKGIPGAHAVFRAG